MTIETQIDQLELSVKAFVESVASLNERLFLKKLDSWSPRDIVAHLIGWNRYVIEGSRQIRRGELPFYDIDPGEDYSKVNAVHLLDYPSKDKRLLLDELQTSAGELGQFLRSLDANEWERDYGVRHHGETITIRNTIDDLIDDYAHHKEQIVAWVKSLPPQ